MNHLPPEVLASCATFVSDTDPRPIVSLTHVCRYWRRSISSNPRSWASISTGWERLVPLCLERAGEVPLAIDITVPDIRSSEDFLELLPPHTSRICHLRLAGYPSVEAVANNLPGFFASPLSSLTSLELQQAEEPSELFPSSESPFPPIFQNVSMLKSLCLTRTPLYPPLFGITSLVELKLLGYTSPFHFGTFIGFLESNLALETLNLDISFVDSSVWTDAARVVNLAHLQHLTITCAKPTEAKGLLSYITLPHGLHLEVIYSKSDQPALSHFLPSPPTPIQDALTPAIAIQYRYTPREFSVFGSIGSFSFRSSSSTLLGPEVYLFTATSVREFHVHIAPWVLSPTFFTWLLPQFPVLETLVIENCTLWATGAFDSLAGEQLLCPSLKTIAFFNCILTPAVMEELEGMVVRRMGLAATWLYQVVIVSSTGVLPDHTLIQQLRQHVPCVDVRVDNKLPDLS